MAVGKVITNVVDVGQGQCTFVEVYDNSKIPKLTDTLMFDCGTDKESPETDANLTYVANKIKEQNPPFLDLLVLSHSDNDHISLLMTLKAKVGANFKVGAIWYAGDPKNYVKHGIDFLDEYQKIANSCDSTQFNYTSFDQKTGDFKNFIWQSKDKKVQVGIIASNTIDQYPTNPVATSFGSTAEEKNRVSIIAALFHSGEAFVICGDATNATMAWANYYMGTQSLSGCQMLTLPHHGSRATGLAVSGSKAANTAAIDVVKEFSNSIRAKTTTISSFGKHSHPSVELIQLFTGFLEGTPIISDSRFTAKSNSHYLVAYNDVNMEDSANDSIATTYWSLTTKNNIYNTYYNDGAFAYSYDFSTASGAAGDAAKWKTGSGAVNAHACWVYTTFPTNLGNMYGCSAMGAAAFTNVGTLPVPSKALSAKTAARSAIAHAVPRLSLPHQPAVPMQPPKLRSPEPLPKAAALRRLTAFR